MKHISLRALRGVVLCLCLLSGIDVIAYDAQIDGIYYNFSGDEAEVTYQKYESSTYRYFSDYSGSVVIPESVTYNGKAYQVTSIGTLAFYQCNSLTSVTIPNSVTNIGIGAFSGCSELTFISIPENVTSIGEGAFENCINLESITIPNGITGISDVVFVRCSSLKSITIPESVKSIGNYAFSQCSSLERLSLGKNIEEIGTSVFGGCDALRMVRAYWEIPIETSSNTFSTTVYDNAKLYIPNGAREAYLATSCWNKFKNILPMTAEVIATATEGGSVSINGSEAISNGTQSYRIDCGTEVTFDFVAKEDYYLESVTTNGEVITDQIEDGRFTIASLEGDMTVIAIYSPIVRYSVAASVVTLGGSGGSLDWVLGRSGITKGSLDCVLEGSGAHEGSLDSLEQVVTGVGGTVVVADSIVTSGQSTTVTIIANEGYELKSVTVNGEDKTAEVEDSVLTLTDIREDKAVVATFQKQRFTISAVHGEGGSISLSATTVEWGDSVTAIVTADEGYEVATLKVGSEDISASVAGKKNVKCGIRNVTKDIVVSATFKATFAIIELTSDGERTYCCNHDLDFSQTNEIRAYIASGYYLQTGYVLLTRVLEVPAGTGIVVRGEEGTYKIPSGESSAYYLNLLKGNLEPVTVEPVENDLANLCLTMGTDGLGFYPVTTAYMMDANSARLQLPAYLLGGESCVKIAYEEDADAVRAAIGTQEDAPVYDLSGRQIVNGKSQDSKLRRGIYIRNGKKVMIK